MHLYTAKTFYGLEKILSKELEDLGAQETKLTKRAVHFKANKETLYRINLFSRLALTVLFQIKQFHVSKPEDIYKNALNIDWNRYFKPDKTIFIDSVVHSSLIRHSQYAAQVTKDAIADYFRKKTGQRPFVDKDNPDIVINLTINENKARISLSTNGTTLNRRGYRISGGYAPLNEVLAAGLIRLAEWNGNSHFIDPFCGSGTIAIEAAMIARNIPSGYFRDKLSIFFFNDFDNTLWTSLKHEAKNKIKNTEIKIIASDIAPRAFRIARDNINAINLIKTIKLIKRPFEEISPVAPASIITNPPYGERLSQQDITDLYKRFAGFLAKNFQGQKLFLITNYTDALSKFPFNKLFSIPLYNGPLECVYQGFFIK